MYSHLQQVAVVTAFGCASNSLKVSSNLFTITLCSQFFQALDLGIAYGGIINGQYIQRVFLSQTILVQANDGFLAAVDVSLTASCALFDTHLGQAGGNSLGHTAQSFNLLNMSPSTANNLISEVFQIIGTAPRVNNLANLGLVLNIQLGITGQASGEISRQRDSFVQSVSMQGLGVAQGCGHSLHTGSGNIVKRILLGQGPARGLAMGAQRHGFRILGTKALQDLSPQHASRTHLGHFHEVVFAHIPEEGQAFREGIHRQAGSFAGTNIFHTICQSIAQLQVAGSAAFLNMIAGNRNAVEFGHIFSGIFKNIADNTHGHSRRINIGITHHEFLQDIVLNGACHNGFINALLLAGNDEEGQNRQYGAVHGHGYGHLIQRNAAEQNIHVQHGAYRYASLTYVAYNTWVISIIAAVGGQVEGDGQALLTSSQVAAVKRVGFLRSGEACILAYSPGTENIHGGIGATQEWRNAAHKVQMVAFSIDILGIQRFFRNALQGCIVKGIIIFAHFRFQVFLPFFIRAGRMIWNRYFSEIRINAHYSIIPFFCCSFFKVAKQLALTLIKSSTPAAR